MLLPRVVPGRALATLVTPADRPAPPLLLAAVRELGLPADPAWVLALGNGDDLQRAVFHVSHEGRRRWVLKFSRVRGHDAPFQRDAEGLALAQSCPVVAARAPQLLGRLTVSGLPLSVESAAPGHPPGTGWPGTAARRGPVSLLDGLAAWVVAVGVATAEPADALRARACAPGPGGAARVASRGRAGRPVAGAARGARRAAAPRPRHVEPRHRRDVGNRGRLGVGAAVGRCLCGTSCTCSATPSSAWRARRTATC